MGRSLVTEKDILRAARAGMRELSISEKTLITPLARDTARQLGVVFVLGESLAPLSPPEPGVSLIAIGSDHSGFAAKDTLRQFLSDQQYRVLDVGTDSGERCDYPDFAYKVGEAVMTNRASFGLMIDGTGIASSMVLNKLPGIRAACCYNELAAKLARAHTDANVLTLGASMLGGEMLRQITLSFLTTVFEGGRHRERLQKLREIEKKFYKS
jgi:ribose 5-phosphate isomerase B